jgi:hypothetical protein
MWKYILAFTLSVIGIVEIVLALNAGLREGVTAVAFATTTIFLPSLSARRERWIDRPGRE